MTTIAFDTETHGFDWFDGENAFLVSWADADEEYAVSVGDDPGIDRFLDALNSADRVVAHNLPFDAHQLRETLGYDLFTSGKELIDTDITSRVVHPEVGRAEGGNYKLKTLATRFVSPDAADSEEAIKELGESMGVAMGKAGAYYDIWRGYPEEMEQYARNDARITFDLDAHLEQELASVGTERRELLDMERQVTPILVEAEKQGIRLDPEVVEDLTKEYTIERDKLREQLVDDFGETALGGEGSKQALLDALEKMGVPLYRKTEKTGELKTDKFALQEFEDDFPQLKTFGEFRTADKFLSTYLGPMEGREFVHTSFGQCNAWTGRMSSFRPNMQNLPKKAEDKESAEGKKIRSVFIPREGHSFVVCDFDSIEIRLLAYYMANESFIKLIEDGHDPHAWMAANIHGGEMDDYLKGTDGQPLRDIAKNTLFAITYGAGAPRVADMNKIEKKDAKALIAKIKGSLPGYYRLQGRIRRKVAIDGYVTTMDGRRQIVKKDKAYVGLNALIQGTAAGIMKRALVATNEAVHEYGATPLLVVHDEALIEVPTENVERVLELTNEAMANSAIIRPALKATGSVVHTNYADA